MQHVVFSVLLVAAAVGAGLRARAEPGNLAQPRIVVVGDVHGAANGFAAILEKAGVIDAHKRWTGGNTILVQTGDMTDRGAGMKDALDLLMALEEQAPKAGGRVQPVLGNHEIMNLTGEMRDVTPEIFATFGGEAAMRQAFSPTGRYGRWLRMKPIIAEINDTVFMHAGINPEYTSASLDELNTATRRELRRWDEGVRWLQLRRLVPDAPALRTVVDAARGEIQRINAAVARGRTPDDALDVSEVVVPLANLGDSPLFHPDGPLWFRGFSTWTDEEGASRMDALLRRYRVKRFVTGHTVQPQGRITERFDGTLFLIDTGMLGRPYFPGGRPSALILDGDAARPLYLE